MNNQNLILIALFLYVLTTEHRELMVFLGCLLQIYQHYHKNIHSDSLTIVTLRMHINALKKAVNSLKETDLTGSWEERLKEMVDLNEHEEFFLKGFELTSTSKTRGRQQRSFREIRNDIIDFLMKYIDDRFQIDEEIIRLAEPIIKMCAGTDDIKKVHKMFAPDQSLATLNLQYNGLVKMKLWGNVSLSTKIKHLKQHENSAQFDCVTTVFSRIQSCTPQSADCE